MNLSIQNLKVSVDDKQILKGLNLEIKEGEIHALMGPNGNGKSTLLATIMGNPNYHIDEGKILYNGNDLSAMSVDQRAKAGIFLAMQYPPEIAGVTNSDFFRAALNAKEGKPVSLFTFIKDVEQATKELELKPDLAHRFLNEGFSGGEKKRNEIVQMMLLKPELAMLDEIDSGLDVDALKIVASSLNKMHTERPELSMIIVSHYERFYQLVAPTKVHVLIDGKILVEGGPELSEKIDKEGYQWIGQQYHVDITDVSQPKPKVSLGSCGANPFNKGE